MSSPTDRDALFLHGFQHGRLGFGCGSIDFIGQDKIGKDRTFLESKCSSASIVFDQHVRAGDVGGHQVRRELNATEAEVSCFTDGPDHQGLAQTRNTFEEHVAAGEDGRQDFINLPRVTNNPRGNGLFQLVVFFLELMDALFAQFMRCH